MCREAESTDFVVPDALEALQKPRSKALAIVLEVETPAEALEEATRILRCKSSLKSCSMLEKSLLQRNLLDFKKTFQGFQNLNCLSRLAFADLVMNWRNCKASLDSDTEVPTTPAKVQRISSLHAAILLDPYSRSQEQQAFFNVVSTTPIRPAMWLTTDTT